MLPDRHSGQMVDAAVEAATAQTPAGQPTSGQRLVASVEASVRAYRRGWAKAVAEPPGDALRGEPGGADHAALVRGLREAAGWLAGHPEVRIRLPELLETMDSREEVEQVAQAAGVETITSPGGHVSATVQFGPVTMRWAWVPVEAMERYRAHMTYSHSVQPAGGDSR